MIEVDDVLRPGGVFHQRIADFIPRVAQQEMSKSVAEALTHNGQLVVESGTGTGKTYAYLVPVVLSKKKTIISTATKHLQEQIFYRDLPVVLDMLNAASGNEAISNEAVPNEAIKVALLKGRANYLCRYRHKMNRSQSDLIGKRNLDSYESIDKWAVKTEIGDIAEISEIGEDSPIWKKVTSTADNCLGNKCPDFNKCFVSLARQRALKADVVVVNHHLFFSDLTLKTEGFGELLPDHDAVIFDEAHSLPEIAAHFFGFSLSSFQLRDLLTDVLAAEKLEQSSVDFSDCNLTIGSAIEAFQGYCQKLKNTSAIMDDLIGDQFDQRFNDLAGELDRLLQALIGAAIVGEGLDKCRSRCALMIDQIDLWRENREQNSVSWLENDKSFFRFHMTPLNITNHFNRFLENPDITWIFTSATLAVGDDFSAYCRKIGLKNAETRRWDSPYDFQNHALLYLPKSLPDPRDPGFIAFLAKTIVEVVDASYGRTFCLFTSHAMMEKAYAEVCHNFSWPLMMQGQASKQHLLEKFTQTKNAVLFGTASFWEGVDVKGDALSCVIIDKLPFDSPSNPVLKRKLQKCEEAGGNPFMEIQIPDAVISLKQGAGRLIRSESDTGVLVLCDSRIVSKAYGKLFLKSLPSMPVTQNISDVERFYRQ